MMLDDLITGDISLSAIWNAYLDGVNYNAQLELPATVEENNNMYIGRQWEGIEIAGLPTVVLNFIKPVVQYKVASITNEKTKITVQPAGLPGAANQKEEEIAAVVNRELEDILEREKLDTLILRLMTYTAVEGDGCWHVYWDDRRMGGLRGGGLAIENIRNLNVFFGNTASPEAQEQPYIIIERREYISGLRTYGAGLGLSQSQVDNILPDGDNQYAVEGDDGRVTVLTFYWRDPGDGRIKLMECTQNVLLRDKTDTGLAYYPLAWQNWEPRLNDYHGEACVSELVTNQITINKLATMKAVSLSRTAFPTIVYNSELLPGGWDNSVGAAIGVPNLPNLNARDVATVIDGAATGTQVDRFFNDLMTLTKDLNGASDAILGSVDPNNTSAIIAVQKTALVPLELNRRRLYAFLEDFARVAIDFMASYYGKREVPVYDPETGEERPETFDFGVLKEAAFNIRIDVGASAYWSELTELHTLDNLFNKQIIGPTEYLEELPGGLIANKQRILKKLKKAEQDQRMAGQQDAFQSMLGKSPELAAQLEEVKENDPEGYLDTIRKMNQRMRG